MKLLIKKIANSNLGIYLRNKFNLKPLIFNISKIKNSSVSDAFIWRTDNNFQTKFKYTDIFNIYYKIPNSVVEAAYIGVPIISSQSHGGINEILNNGKYGTIYNGGYLDLALKIKNFYTSPKIFYKKANLAKKNVIKFNISNHKINFEKLIDKI